MGPLSGIKIVELAGIGPAPFAAMLLADLGASVVRIDRPTPANLGIERPLKFNLLMRNRQNLTVDLKSEDGRALVLRLVEKSDGLIEGFRPGVTERLGLGPEDCMARNPRLVYGRMTGWGQEGPLAQAAGHDLNYVALTGVLDSIGREGAPPTLPHNLIGDFGGGGMYLALGLLAAMLESKRSGQGQVIDAAIVDGTAAMATSLFGMYAADMLGKRGTNILDGGAPFYDVYECADGKLISVAPIEPKFFAQLCALIEIDPITLGPQNDRSRWPDAKKHLAAKFKSRTRDEWCKRLEGSDACFAPVLDASEAPLHPHLAARGTFIEVDGVVQPAPAPRFSRTVPCTPRPPASPSESSAAEVLEDWLGPQEARLWREKISFRQA